MKHIEPPRQQQQRHGPLLCKLMATAVAMFAFALFVLPPMYEVLCELTGLNGKVNQSSRRAIDPLTNNTNTTTNNTNTTQQTITVQFVTDTDHHSPWPFFPQSPSISVQPGDIKHVSFRVENPHKHAVIAQAIPSISPAVATPYFKKTECFCFNQQPLAAFEGKDMGLIFHIDPAIPDHIRTITLSYRLYDITDTATSSNSEQVTHSKGDPNNV